MCLRAMKSVGIRFIHVKPLNTRNELSNLTHHEKKYFQGPLLVEDKNLRRLLAHVRIEWDFDPTF